MTERLGPLFESDGQGKDRRWTVQNVIERLKQVTRNEVECRGVRFHLPSGDGARRRAVSNPGAITGGNVATTLKSAASCLSLVL